VGQALKPFENFFTPPLKIWRGKNWPILYSGALEILYVFVFVFIFVFLFVFVFVTIV